MLTGRIEHDSSGLRIMTTDMDWNEPRIVTTIWRVVVIDGPAPQDGTLAVLRPTGVWDCGSAQCSVAQQAESIELTPIKPPRGKRGRVEWRDGEWKPKRKALEG